MPSGAEKPWRIEPAFRGNALGRVDGGVLELPAAFRFVGDAFITSMAGQSVLIYPLRAWEQFEAILEADPNGQRILDRTYYYGSAERVTANGTLLLPERLRTDAGLDGEVLVIGRIDHLDIWNTDRFQEHLKQEP